MLIDDIKKANIEAMKAHDNAARSVYSIIISRYLELKTSGSGKPVTDADVLGLIRKLNKELDEEKESFVRAGRSDALGEITSEKNKLARFIPAQLSEEKIREVISSLDDKSIPSVMKYFKEHFSGQVDMSLVSKIARGL